MLTDLELCEELLAFGIRDDCLAQWRDFQAGRESWESLNRRGNLLNKWLSACIKRRRDKQQQNQDAV